MWVSNIYVYLCITSYRFWFWFSLDVLGVLCNLYMYNSIIIIWHAYMFIYLRKMIQCGLIWFLNGQFRPLSCKENCISLFRKMSNWSANLWREIQLKWPMHMGFGWFIWFRAFGWTMHIRGLKLPVATKVNICIVYLFFIFNKNYDPFATKKVQWFKKSITRCFNVCFQNLKIGRSRGLGDGLG